MSSQQLSIQHHESLAEIDAADWNRLNSQANPFLQYEFLHGLERTDCLEPEGWYGRHLTVKLGQTLIAALPLYLRTNSYGEFVFDWAWADAFERAGGRYYPKLVSAIPFTPVVGERLLVDENYPDNAGLRKIIIEQLIETAGNANISSYHCLFPVVADRQSFTEHELLQRKGFQFHWHNRDYRDFDEFLASLSSKKRKQIKRERRQALEHGIDIDVLKGGDITEEQWQVFYGFYCSTFHRRWGNPRLTLEFFKLLSRDMPDATLLIMAKKGAQYIAGAFTMLGKDTVYGRHWGCSEQLPFLHFELCYYQTIDYCIKNQLKVVDAGVQGEHKLSRGFTPVPTWSCHWINHSGFRESVAKFLLEETREIDYYIESMGQHSPYKSTS